jgi:hypothetical protein
VSRNFGGCQAPQPSDHFLASLEPELIQVNILVGTSGQLSAKTSKKIAGCGNKMPSLLNRHGCETKVSGIAAKQPN